MHSDGSDNNLWDFQGNSEGIPWRSTVKHSSELLPVHPFYVYNMLHTFLLSPATGKALGELAMYLTS